MTDIGQHASRRLPTTPPESPMQINDTTYPDIDVVAASQKIGFSTLLYSTSYPVDSHPGRFLSGPQPMTRPYISILSTLQIACTVIVRCELTYEVDYRRGELS